MSDLISRQEVMDALKDEYNRRAAESGFSPSFGLKLAWIEKTVNSAPSAQPEIIRCKDCKHWDTTWQIVKNVPDYHYCHMIHGSRKSDFYCADAERRGGE